MSALYHAHSGLRYLVLLAGVAALISLAYSLASGRAMKVAYALSGTFTGLLDLQILLGIALVMGGLFPDAVAGHLALMIFAAVSAHAASIMGKRSSNDRRELVIRITGTLIALALIVGGILAIGRSVLGSQARRFAFVPFVLLALPFGRVAAQSPATRDSVDVAFVQGMMHHHAQAIVMSQMAASHTMRSDLRTAARKIIVSQRDEIALMRRWLEKHGRPVPSIDTAPPDTTETMAHAAHHMVMMAGMLTPAQLRQLARARGAEFDRLYLDDMIAHHRGALSMVAKLFSFPGATDDSEIYQLASEIDADQSAEIARMQSMQTHPPKKRK